MKSWGEKGDNLGNTRNPGQDGSTAPSSRAFLASCGPAPTPPLIVFTRSCFLAARRPHGLPGFRASWVSAHQAQYGVGAPAALWLELSLPIPTRLPVCPGLCCHTSTLQPHRTLFPSNLIFLLSTGYYLT